MDSILPDDEDENKITDSMRKSWRRKGMMKPVQPEDESCCGGGCCPCVFDGYYKLCHQYKLYLRFLEEEESNKLEKYSIREGAQDDQLSEENRDSDLKN